MSEVDPRLLDMLRDRMGVPDPLIRAAVRQHTRSGRPLAAHLVEMGLATPEQLSSLLDALGPEAPPGLLPPLPRRGATTPPRPEPSAAPLPPELPVDRGTLPPKDNDGLIGAPVLGVGVGFTRDAAEDTAPSINRPPELLAARPLPPLPTPASRPSGAQVPVSAPAARASAPPASAPPASAPSRPTPAASVGSSVPTRPSGAAAAPAGIAGLDSETARQQAADLAQRRDEALPRIASGAARYTVGDEIARGGMGRILAARDENLGRTVAMKLLLNGKAEKVGIQLRFSEEAQITGQLQHPNIVPVHELGVSEDGDLYFTMKRVHGRTLREILRQIRRRDEATVRAFTRSRLLNAFKQVCLGVAYAHSRGVVHRDLKPSNIMFGDYGEVLIMDWGLAKILPAGRPGQVQSHRAGQQRWATRHGEVIGTPGYMPPELALGQLDDVDERADIYSLGALLYEMLTLRPTYTGPDARTILKKMLHEPLVPPRARAPELDIPADIEAICLRCLAKPIADRYGSALAVHDAVEAFLEGALARDRRRAQAHTDLDAARGHAEQSVALLRRVQQLEADITSRRAQLTPWAGVERRRELWAAEENLEAARRDRTEAFTRAVQGFRHARQLDPDLVPAADGLGHLYWQAFELAERAADQGAQQHCEALLRELDLPQFATRLKGDGRLHVQSDPPGVRAVLFRLEPVDLVLTPVEPRDLGPTPVSVDPLPMGNYLLVLRAPGLREAQIPLRIERLGSVEVNAKLYSDAHLGRGFVYIPGGQFALGGDPDAHWPLPAQAVSLPGFCIARLPVSCRQYQDFLDAVAERDVNEARERRPRLFAHGGYLFEERDGRFFIPDVDPSGTPWDPNWPVFGVSHEDALAYCAWRSAVDGVPYRLPTEQEWEAAARGADGRRFVWGDRWEPTYCKSAHARAGAPTLEPCGTYPTDRSPYGVLDLAGGVADWTMTPVGDDERICRGGSWNQLELYARAASRRALSVDAVSTHVGFRLARDP